MCICARSKHEEWGVPDGQPLQKMKMEEVDKLCEMAGIKDVSSLTITAFVKNRYLQPSLFVVKYQSIFIF